MWNTPSKQRLGQIPALYETESTDLQDKKIYLHFFLGGCDWYVAEFNGKNTFWGFVIMNGDLLNAEWGYFTLSELQDINVHGVEIDCELEHWQIRTASQVNKISQAQGWDLAVKTLNRFNTAAV